MNLKNGEKHLFSAMRVALLDKRAELAKGLSEGGSL